MPPQQGGGVTTQTNNIAAAEITGVEIENNVRLVEGLTAFLNYAYTNAKYTRYPGTTIDSAGNVRRNIDRSEEHTSELQSLMRISYAVFCLKKKKTQKSLTYKINE